MTTIASGLLEKDPEDAPYGRGGHNFLYGIHATERGEVYVASLGARSVLGVGRDGKVRTIYRAEAPWFPTGVAAVGKVLYLRETAFTEDRGHHGTRLRRMVLGGEAKTVAELEH